MFVFRTVKDIHLAGWNTPPVIGTRLQPWGFKAPQEIVTDRHHAHNAQLHRTGFAQR